MSTGKKSESRQQWMMILASQLKDLSPLRKAVQQVEDSVPNERVLIVITESQRSSCMEIFSDFPSQNILIQPSYRGSSPEILFGVTELLRKDRSARVIVSSGDLLIENLHKIQKMKDRLFQFIEERLGFISLGEESYEASEISPKIQRIFGHDSRSQLILAASASTLLLAYSIVEPELCQRFVSSFRNPLNSGDLQTLYSSVSYQNFLNRFLDHASAYFKIFPAFKQEQEKARPLLGSSLATSLPLFSNKAFLDRIREKSRSFYHLS